MILGFPLSSRTRTAALALLLVAASALGLGVAVLDRRLRPAADSLAISAAAAEPPEAARWRGRAGYYERRGRLTEALEAYGRALEARPDDWSLWADRAGLHGRLSQWEAMAEDFTHAIEQRPTEPGPWYGRGVAHAQMGLGDRAAADFGKAIDRKLPGARAWYGRALAHFRAGRYAEAEEDLTGALGHGAPTAQAYDARGQARAELGRWAEAAEDFGRAAALAPWDPWLGYREAVAWLAAGQHEQYRAACASLLERFRETSDPEAAARVVRAATAAPGALGEPGALVSLAGRVAAAHPGQQHLVAAVLVRAGRPEEAVQHFREAARVRLPRGVDLALLALALYRAGRPEEARKEFEVAGCWAREHKLDWGERVETEDLLREVGELLGIPPPE